MPNLDRTGPLGNGPQTGLGRGLGRGRRVAPLGRGLGGTRECTCPKCGHKEMHQRGIPCSEKMCPKCNTPMKGAYCL